MAVRIELGRAGLAVALGLLAGACASNEPQGQIQSATSSSDQAANAFRAAVVDVCVASAIGGTPVSNLATETGPIVRATNVSAGKPGEEVFESRAARGVVIRANAGECQVSASGPAAAQTLEAIGQGLKDPHGFLPDPQTKGAGGDLLQRYTRDAGGKKVYVTLQGSATAQPSTLVATVTSGPPPA